MKNRRESDGVKRVRSDAEVLVSREDREGSEGKSLLIHHFLPRPHRHPRFPEKYEDEDDDENEEDCRQNFFAAFAAFARHF
jgi:hypothetical protein